jgi:hypothetical protein
VAIKIASTALAAIAVSTCFPEKTERMRPRISSRRELGTAALIREHSDILMRQWSIAPTLATYPAMIGFGKNNREKNLSPIHNRAATNAPNTDRAYEEGGTSHGP